MPLSSKLEGHGKPKNGKATEAIIRQKKCETSLPRRALEGVMILFPLRSQYEQNDSCAVWEKPMPPVQNYSSQFRQASHFGLAYTILSCQLS
jgi:hypothetical protein